MAALSVINSARVSISVTWDVVKSVTGFAGVRSNETITRLVNFTLGTGADQINEIYTAVLTVNAATTTDFDLTPTLTNVVNDLLIVLARVKFLMIELLTATDTDPAGTVIGTAASSITVFGDANSLPALNTAATTTTLGNGDAVVFIRRSATGIVVTGGTGDVLQIQNNDGATAAKVRVTLFGAAT